MDNRIYILTEAGYGIGLGHLTRCVALADKLFEKGFDVIIIVNVKGIINFDEHYIYALNWLDEKLLVDILKETSKCHVIIDSYLVDYSYFKFLNVVFEKIIVIDDYNRISYPYTDLIINPDIYGDKIDYSNQIAAVVGGKDYIIIREAFLKYKDKFIVSKDISCLGITLGGTDFRKLLPVLCNYFKEDTRFIKVIVFSGSESCKTMLKIDYTNQNFEFYGYLGADAMVQNLFRCDLVISASGQTLNELAFLGIPTIAICLDKDQEYNTKGYSEYGFLSVALSWEQKDLMTSIGKIIDTYSYFEKRNKVNKIGKKIVNGDGATNIIKTIDNL